MASSAEGCSAPARRARSVGRPSARVSSLEWGPAWAPHPRPPTARPRRPSRSRSTASTSPGSPASVVASAAYVACDVTTTRHRELVGLMRTLTDRARFLTAGGRPPDVGISALPSDSGVLGPEVPADGLTVTVGGRRHPVRRPVRAARPASRAADADGHLPRRRPRPRPVPRRPEAADRGAAPGHGAARAARHRPPHPGCDAGALAHGRLRLAAAPVRHAAQPDGLQGRHAPTRPPTSVDRLVWVGSRRAGLDRRRQLPGGPADPDAGRVLGPGRDSTSRSA